MRSAVVISTEGETTPVAPENGKSFSLKELYTLTQSSLVQVIDLRDGRQMWMDEEGKLTGKEPNFEATILASGTIFPEDYIAGPVVVCSRGMVK